MKKTGLIALLCLNGCSLFDRKIETSFDSYKENGSAQFYSSSSSSNIGNSSGNLVTDSSIVKPEDIVSPKIGPFVISTNKEKTSIEVEVPYLPRFGIQLDNVFEYSLYRDNLNQGITNYREIDNWMVGNGSHNEFERQEVPLSAVGRLVKDFLWDTSYVAPVRRIAEQVSSVSDNPARLIFGESAESKLEFKIDESLDIKRMGISWNVGFMLDYRTWDFDMEYQSSENGESAIGIYFSTKFGQRR